MDVGIRLGREKYGTPAYDRQKLVYKGVDRLSQEHEYDLNLTVFLPSTGDRQITLVNCCRWRGPREPYGDYDSIDAELHYLTPSSPVWSGPHLGSLDIPADKYHQHYIMHEMMHVIHMGVTTSAAKWNTPRWIKEGLAEYDGFFHSNHYNRTTAIDALINRVYEQHRDDVHCCTTLKGANRSISTTRVYYGGATILMFLAEEFGESIHVELLNEPVRAVLERRGSSLDQVFSDLRRWLEQKSDLHLP